MGKETLISSVRTAAIIAFISWLVPISANYIYEKFSEQKASIIYAEWGFFGYMPSDTKPLSVHNIHGLGFINFSEHSINNEKIYLDVKNYSFLPFVEDGKDAIVNIYQDTNSRFVINIEKIRPSGSFKIVTIGRDNFVPVVGIPIASNDDIEIIKLDEKLLRDRFSNNYSLYFFISLGIFLITLGYLYFFPHAKSAQNRK
jgi:hypothetical protein